MKNQSQKLSHEIVQKRTKFAANDLFPHACSMKIRVWSCHTKSCKKGTNLPPMIYFHAYVIWKIKVRSCCTKSCKKGPNLLPMLYFHAHVVWKIRVRSCRKKSCKKGPNLPPMIYFHAHVAWKVRVRSCCTKSCKKGPNSLPLPIIYFHKHVVWEMENIFSMAVVLILLRVWNFSQNLFKNSKANVFQGGFRQRNSEYVVSKISLPSWPCSLGGNFIWIQWYHNCLEFHNSRRQFGSFRD